METEHIMPTEGHLGGHHSVREDPLPVSRRRWLADSGGGRNQTRTQKRLRAPKLPKNAGPVLKNRAPRSNGEDVPFQRLELEQIPFEILETALYELLRIVKDKENLRFVRESDLPPTIAQFKLYVVDERPDFASDSDTYLGYIRMTRLSIDVSQIELGCYVRGRYNQLYVDLVKKWKVYASSYEMISSEVRKRNKGRGLRKLKKGRPGRPSFAEDIWAWQQVNVLERSANDVYKEWLENPKVKARDLRDPHTHFYRFIKRNKMGD